MNKIKDINKFKKEYNLIYNLGNDASLIQIQKLSRMRKQYISRFDGLKMSDQTHMLLVEDTIVFMNYTNGVGSEVGWFNSFFRWILPSWVRNKLFGVDITPASDLHDVEYSAKVKFKTIADGEAFKDNADGYFKDNMQYLIKEDKNINSLDSLRFVKSRIYFIAVGYCGSASFWAGKIKPKV